MSETKQVELYGGPMDGAVCETGDSRLPQRLWIVSPGKVGATYNLTDRRSKRDLPVYEFDEITRARKMALDNST